MNYPIWDVPSSGLLIAAVAVLHVFISHFAIGGGLFLVLLEGRAYRNKDPELLQYVRGHTRFFVLLTLVLGAVTGVGIWFTISLVHPQATSSLIQIFVWVWAIEWIFFLTEITAAMVYYYGWDRMSSKTHLVVGWIYFGAAWLSLFAINGILTFMLTPGDWIISGSIWDGFFNPTFWPSLISRTLVAFALAGLYAFLTASFLGYQRVQKEVIRYAGLRWLIPAAACLPLALLWYLSKANSAGIPVFEVLGSESDGWLAMFQSLLSHSGSVGVPLAQQAFSCAVMASVLLLLLAIPAVYKARLRPALAVVMLLLGLVAFAGGEWVRESLRKPYVLGRQLFVNSVRLPAGPAAMLEDPLTVEELNQRGVLETALWKPAIEDDLPEDPTIRRGSTLFGLLCTACHTVDGHMGIKSLVRGQSATALETLFDNLAKPVDSTGQTVTWTDPQLKIQSWRGRRMPPFVGTTEEKTLLAHFLASLNPVRRREESVSHGQKLFEEKCLFCHGETANWPMPQIAAGRKADDFYEKLARLPEINPIMPPFEGGEDDRRAVSDYLEALVAKHQPDGETR